MLMIHSHGTRPKFPGRSFVSSERGLVVGSVLIGWVNSACTCLSFLLHISRTASGRDDSGVEVLAGNVLPIGAKPGFCP